MFRARTRIFLFNYEGKAVINIFLVEKSWAVPEVHVYCKMFCSFLIKFTALLTLKYTCTVVCSFLPSFVCILHSTFLLTFSFKQHCSLLFYVLKQNMGLKMSFFFNQQPTFLNFHQLKFPFIYISLLNFILVILNYCSEWLCISTVTIIKWQSLLSIYIASPKCHYTSVRTIIYLLIFQTVQINP